MIRRRPKESRRISARRQALIAYYRKCQIPKLPKGRKALLRHRRELRKAVIEGTRVQVWRRSSVCEFCGDAESDTWRKLAAMGSARPGEHQQHEVFLSRAKGRGLPPAAVFNVWNCARVCPICHDQHHAKLVTVEESAPGAGCTKRLIVTQTPLGARAEFLAGLFRADRTPPK